MESYGSVVTSPRIGRWKQAGSKWQPSDCRHLRWLSWLDAQLFWLTVEGFLILQTVFLLFYMVLGLLVISSFLLLLSIASVKRPARLWDVFSDLLISHPQPLRLCEKLCVPNWGGCWALHVSLRPQQTNGHKVSVSNMSRLLGLWEAGLGSAQRIFSSHLSLWSNSYQKRNSASMKVWEGLLWRVWELGGSAICPWFFSAGLWLW